MRILKKIVKKNGKTFNVRRKKTKVTTTITKDTRRKVKNVTNTSATKFFFTLFTTKLK